jgi:predicted AlkP superfamily phosphohydrolase/phosphomutase/tetratricopeptide (TPR) repeat protein
MPARSVHATPPLLPLGRVARPLLALVAASLLLASACGRRAEPHPVLVIGVDSADWEMIRPMVESGELPTFARLLREGASAPCTTLDPPLSPLLWTSIATGRTPDAHGILDFITRDPRTGRTVPVTSTLRRVEALWNIASDAGRRVAAIGWLASWPAESVSGAIVTDRLAFHPFDPAATGQALEGLTHPVDLADEVRPLMPDPARVPFDSVSRFLAVTPEQYASAPFDTYRPGQLVGNFRRTWAAAEGYRRVTTSLYARGAWDLFLTYFEFLDATSHLFVRHMEPALASLPEEEKRAFGGAISEAYRWQDRVLGEILALVDDNTIVVIVSDHGFLFGERRIAAPSEVLGGEAALWHRDEGIFLVTGPGVRRGARLPPVSILDIAPTILWAMGLPVSDEMPGRPIVQAFEPDFVDARPVERIATYETGEREAEAVEGGEDEAIQERLRALGYLSSEGVNAVINKAIVLRDRGEAAASLAEWQKARELAPERADVAVGLGFALFQNGRPDEAKAEWERALAIDPRRVEAHVDLGNLAYERGDLDEAARRYADAITADSLFTDAYVNLGQVHIDRKAFREAIDVLEQAKAIAPGNAAVRFRLGIAIAQTGGREDAFAELKRALELDRELRVPVGIWIGRVLARDGDLDAAVEQLETVVEIAPQDVEARLELGRVLVLAKKGQRAGQAYMQVLRLDPENEEAKAALAALAKSAPPR